MPRTWLRHIGEIALVIGAYLAYMYTRRFVFSDFESAALQNAKNIVELEKSLGFFWEPLWQSWAIGRARTIVIFFNWAYIVTYFPIIVATALVMYIANRRRYLYYRNVVLISFTFALLGFMLFPLAPPRMLAEHFVDTIKVFGPAFYASREFANYYNAHAAMPSLHFGWTVILGILFLRTHNRWLRAFGVMYPTMTLLAITITANHYILDAVGSGLMVAASFLTMELGLRRRFFLPQLRTRLRLMPGQHRSNSSERGEGK